MRTKPLERRLNFKRIFINSILACSLLLNPLTLNSLYAEGKPVNKEPINKEKKLSPFIDIGFLNLNVDSKSGKVSDIPEYIRRVNRSENATPIPDKLHFGVVDFILPYLSVGLGYNFSSCTVEIGGNLNLRLNYLHERKAINWQGTNERGLGKALIYYELCEGVFNKELFFKILKKDSPRWFLEYNLNLSDIFIDSGIDEWNHYTRLNSFKIAHLMEHNIIVGRRSKADIVGEDFKIEYYIGFSYPVTKYTSLGEEMKIEIPNTVTFGLKLNLSFLDFIKKELSSEE